MFLITTNIYKNIYKSNFAIESNITGIMIYIVNKSVEKWCKML